jgi:phosphoenolpyruvate synthase/pyruvate phosphate dikinase
VTAVVAPVPRATVPSLRDVRFADARAVGGKAASLGELLAAGVRVPDGVVLTADVARLDR